MQLSKPEITKFTAKFDDADVEEIYAEQAARQYARVDTGMIFAALSLFALYGLIDLKSLQHGTLIASIRISFVMIALSILFLLHREKKLTLLPLHAATSMTCAGLIVCFSIWLEQSDSNEYYKGIVQIILIGTLLVRVEFVHWALALMLITGAFIVSSAGIFEGQRYNNLLLFIAIVAVICAVGVYNLERSRRIAFLMQLNLKNQSDQLKVMNDREVLNAKSKNAMINILAHFYRTPIHQIKGYSELLQSSGDTLDEATSSDYLDQIINSTVSLNRFTQKVLQYNALPDRPKVDAFKTMSINAILRDALYDAGEIAKVETDIDDFEITGPTDQMVKIMSGLIENIEEHGKDANLINLSAHQKNGLAYVEITDDGEGMSMEQFNESILPFQEVTKFMAMGQKVPMGLRYAEKVLHSIGGHLTCIAQPRGTKIQLVFPVNPVISPENDLRSADIA